MKTNLSIAALVLSLVALSGPARADVVRAQHQFRGERAEAEFHWTEDDCTEGWLYVAGGETVTHDVGDGPVTTSLAYAAYVTMNRCTGEHQRAFGSIEGGAIIDRLDHASLRIPMSILRPVCSERGDGGMRCDEVPTGEVAVLEVEIVGEGASVHGITLTSSSFDGFHSVTHDVGRTREGSASATLVFGGLDHLEGAITTRAVIGSSESNEHSLTRL